MKILSMAFLALMVATLAHSGAPTDSEKLDQVIHNYTEAGKRVDPFYATIFGVEEDLSKFGDYPSDTWMKRSKALYLKALQELKKVNRKKLSETQALTYDLFKEDMQVSLKGFNFPNELLEFNQMDNRMRSYLDDSSPSMGTFPLDSVKHYDDFVKRSEEFPAYVDRQIELLRKGITKRIVLSCVAAEKALNSVQDGLEPVVEKHAFWRPVAHFPKDFSSADQSRFKESFRVMIEKRIVPGFKKFDAFFRSEYLPHCRKDYGYSKLPNAPAWYSYRILKSTNLTRSAAQIHAMGVKEVARINTEMAAIQREMAFKGTLAEFKKKLMTDPAYYFKSASEMFDAFKKQREFIAKKIPQYFSTIPKSEYKLVEAENPEDASASYKEPTDSQPYGRFVINTTNLKTLPTWEVATLSQHESVPGHHFQLALQFEMKDQLSEYQRKLYFSTAFVEGWALYAEYLGREMGAYTDSLQRFGNLNDEMLRAVRLVVDTGMHSMGWSREKVIAYMNENLASDPADNEREADRYSVWPGQALAYKTGQLKIIELRKEAEKALGSKFDIKEFHKVVIGQGTVSLGILDRKVKAWIKAAQTL